MFVGFLNQLCSISMTSELEFLRILLFKFGGEDTHWSITEIEACRMYLHYFASRLVEQCGRRRALFVLWSMQSGDLQRLFQGKLRKKEQAAVRDEEIAMF